MKKIYDDYIEMERRILTADIVNFCLKITV